jgi:hypothetical protein
MFTKCAREDKRGVDLISDALPFGRLWYGEPRPNQQRGLLYVVPGMCLMSNDPRNFN